jgi:hypothetical protein
MLQGNFISLNFPNTKRLSNIIMKMRKQVRIWSKKSKSLSGIDKN